MGQLTGVIVPAARAQHAAGLIEQYHALRYERYVMERHWEPANEARRESDRWDNYPTTTVLLLVADFQRSPCGVGGGRVMAGYRILSPHHDRLPADEYFLKNRVCRTRPSVEISRAVNRKGSKFPLDLFSAGGKIMRENGIDTAYAMIEHRFARMLKRLCPRVFEDIAPGLSVMKRGEHTTFSAMRIHVDRLGSNIALPIEDI